MGNVGNVTGYSEGFKDGKRKATTEILEIIKKKIESLEKEFNKAEGDTDFTFDLRVRIMDIEEIKKVIEEV